ncbi:phospho-2-dehydro-3-deoxyheptonate aldolase [Alicyclobacillus hesperidum URH17-3-68]|uniref:3-deoxy-7-phosphoheptulonate synthase n=1 Tax=Alicyclobacillus hesperidum TaxID=89784 RepID=A0A1H2R042_9BACL|nr:3-deoxy-7-phosphoheptulonate synthase [Alicyclobacillus hesperidum]EJY55462.1 phospho-2-dehydro-3-deoxyheptonate aldolase [Alicyclobacillus hesperidum URH17-3-68]GLV13250.1 3-deoxy-7-phosphoheptulonate synthase [Alicyclobacillus hesperidum]SDW12244.1 3-deoxy-D-arabinoheptulosonate-7-phosphate synthase [Alicyclobacillus hesperidum]
MIVMLNPKHNQQLLAQSLAELGVTAYPAGANRVMIAGNDADLANRLAQLPEVLEVVPVARPYPLASREFQQEDTVIQVRDVLIGGSKPVVMAGPCSVESVENIVDIAKAVKRLGGHVLRGGAFKPRSSPYSFQGHGEEGLKMMAMAREITGLAIVSEVMEPDKVALVAEYVDILQIGARNMQNYPLLREAGKSMKPVLLKRGLSGTIEEWLMAAEYILAQGNPNVILCERGIRTFETATRNTLDLNAVPVVKSLTHLPVIVDPSHGVGKRAFVRPMARAGVAAGADGVIVEIHPTPDQAMSDAAQTIDYQEFGLMVEEIHRISDVLHGTREKTVVGV